MIMSEGIKSMVSIIVVIVFLYIVFRKRILPLLHKKNNGASGKPPGAAPFPVDMKTSYSVLAVDLLSYSDHIELCEELEMKLVRKMEYIMSRGVVLSTRYIVAGSLLIVVIEWRMKD